jgi:hypothetical protein
VNGRWHDLQTFFGTGTGTGTGSVLASADDDAVDDQVLEIGTILHRLKAAPTLLPSCSID